MTSNKGAAQAAPTLAELAEQIKALRQSGDRTALDNAVEVGTLLIKAKAQVRHGQWEKWVKDTLGMPRVTYARYMRVAANVSSSTHFKSIDEADRATRKPKQAEPAKKKKKQKPESGKKLHTLYAERRTKDNLLIQARIDIQKMVYILEIIDFPRYGIGDADADTVAEIYQDLTVLSVWLDASVPVVAAEISDLKKLDLIRRLRDTNGRTPEEARTFQRMADRLDAKRLQLA